MTEQELLAHATRCNRLAEVCLDPVVANKLRALAQDYRRFAKYPPHRLMAGAITAVPSHDNEPKPRVPVAD